jgi:hypothetical protein
MASDSIPWEKNVRLGSVIVKNILKMSINFEFYVLMYNLN